MFDHDYFVIIGIEGVANFVDGMDDFGGQRGGYERFDVLEWVDGFRRMIKFMSSNLLYIMMTMLVCKMMDMI